jgi:hypothetical protein
MKRPGDIMRHNVRIHYDNKDGFHEPVMWVWVSDGATLEREVTPNGSDEFGVYYDLNYNRSEFNFIFKDGKGEHGRWEDEEYNRTFHICLGDEVWAMANRHNIYNVRPAEPQGNAKDFYRKISHLIPEKNFYLPTTDVSGMKCILDAGGKCSEGWLNSFRFLPSSGGEGLFGRKLQ